MTPETRDKIRSVLLAAIMVISVLGVAGTATADVSSSNRNIQATNNKVQAGSTTTVVTTVTVDEDTARFSLTERFSPAFASASVNSVQINGQSTIPTSATFEDDTGLVVLQNLNAGDKIRVSYTVEVPGNASNGATFRINGSVSVSNGPTVTIAGERRITVGQPQQVGGGQNADVTFNQQVLDVRGGANAVTVGAAQTGGPTTMWLAVWNATANDDPDQIISAKQVSAGSVTNERITGVSIDETQKLIVSVHDGSLSRSQLDDSNALATEDATVHVAQDVTTSNVWFQGQTLYYDASANPGADYTLRRGRPESVGDGDGGTLVGQLDPGPNGLIRIDTRNLRGRYFITTDGGATSVEGNDTRFEVTMQTFNATWEDDTVSTEGPQTESSLEIESNRRSYTVEISEPNLDADDLDDIFKGGSVDEDDDTIEFQASTSTVLDADFQGVDTGDYNFQVSVTDTTASDTAPITVEEIEGQYSFTQQTVEQEAGDVAEFTIELTDTTDGYVFIGTDDVNYVEALYVEDTNGDGEITFTMNTRWAGTNSTFYPGYEDPFSSENDDVTTITDRIFDSQDYADLGVNQTLTQPIEPATYEVVVSSSDEFTITDDGALSITDEEDVTTLNLLEPEIGNMTVWTAPRGSATADELDELPQPLTQRTDIAIDDRIVLEVQVSGIYGVVEDAQTLAASNASLMIQQTNPGPNRDPIRMSFGADQQATSLVVDPANDTLYAIADTSRAQATNTGQNVPELQAGQEFNATLSVDTSGGGFSSNPYFGTNSVTEQFELVDREAEFNNVNPETDTLPLEQGSNVTVTGETTIAPGSEISVRIRGTSDGSTFLRTVDAVVTDNRTFSASFDTSDLDIGATFTAQVRSRGVNIGEIDGEIVLSTTPTPSPTPPPSPTPRIITQTPPPTPEPKTVVQTREVTRTVVKTQEVTRTVVKTQTPGQPGFGIAIAIVALLAAALLALRRRD